MKRMILILISGCLLCPSLFAEPLPAAGIASAHPMATKAGHEILAQGGNAFDAAVAISAALAVVEPTGSGLGGGGFWLLHRAQDRFEVMIDGREKAPGAAHRDMYLDGEGNAVAQLSIDGPLAAAIPGIPAALVHIAKKYGKLSLKQSLQPAIRYAKQGFKVDQHYQGMAKFRLQALLKSPAASQIFLSNDAVPQIDHVIVQTDLAHTLEILAEQGKDGFYQGAIAKQLVEGVRNNQGIWTLKDLADYQIVERKPIFGEYQGIRITSAAPPSSGGIALNNILGILSEYDLATLNQSKQTHLIVEAMRRAYRDRALYLGDPDFVSIPVERLTHPYYAAGQRASISMSNATPSDQLPGIDTGAKGQDTTHFSVIDKQGNRVAATLTINYPFGSCFVAPGTGVLLNDEMDDFSSKPGTPNAYGLVGAEANAIAPGKRPLSSMTPSFLETDNAVVVLGTPGGSRIITMVLLATLDFARGGEPKSMVERGRFHHQYLPDHIQYEEGSLDQNLITQLSQMGHQFKQVKWRYGNMQVVMWDKRHNKVMAASDPRGGGAAIVQ